VYKEKIGTAQAVLTAQFTKEEEGLLKNLVFSSLKAAATTGLN